MSLAKYLSKYGHEGLELAKAHKGKLALAAGLPAAAVGAHELEPKYDEFMQDRAIESIKRNAKRSAIDALDFAEKHPLMVSGALSGAGALGAMQARGGTPDLQNMFVNAIQNQAQPQRRRK